MPETDVPEPHVPDEFARFRALSFDCYGTLIDWEAGLAEALARWADVHHISAPSDELIELVARHETVVQSEQPALRYPDVLSEVLARLARDYGVATTPQELEAFGASVADWPAFADSADALARLARRYRLGVITNCDDDLFAASCRRLGATFDPAVTAQQARAYKPAERGFELAFERLGLPRERILHVAQSLFHDHVTAKRLGLTTVWIDRRAGRDGTGATPVAEAAPDATFSDMAAFAAAATT